MWRLPPVHRDISKPHFQMIKLRILLMGCHQLRYPANDIQRTMTCISVEVNFSIRAKETTSAFKKDKNKVSENKMHHFPDRNVWKRGKFVDA